MVKKRSQGGVRTHQLKAAVFLLLGLLFLPPAGVCANAGPVYLENYPAFSIAPREDSPLIVEREELYFVVDPRISELARVKARYHLKNPSGEGATVSMVFPFVSEGYRGVETEITLDGRPLDYGLYSGGFVDVRDYLKDPETFLSQVQLDLILARLRQPRYQARNFDDTAAAALYEITFREPADREIRIDFTLDPDKTRALAFGELTGFEVNREGSGSVFTYISQHSLGRKGYILVLGEDTLELAVGSGDAIEQRTVRIRDFISERLEDIEGPWHVKQRDPEDFYALYVRELDNLFEHTHALSSHDMIMEEVFLKNNITVLLFEVEIEGRNQKTLEVSYPLWATMDRSRSSSYVNTFAYILNPARNFREFGSLDIRIELNLVAPYIIESSLPLQKGGQGVYSASLEGLPDGDLIFSTYPREEVTYWDRASARLIPRGFEFILIGVAAAIFLALVAFALYRRRRRSGDLDNTRGI